jgi:hypothetical protein
MPDPLAHVYDLALRALAEQERQVAALHNRLAPVLAAGGLGATLLAPAAFRGNDPASIRVACSVLGLFGIGVALIAVAYVLVPRRLRFGLDAPAMLAFVGRNVTVDARRFFRAAIANLDERRLDNASVISRLNIAFTFVLGGMLVGVCGLAAAVAVA